MIWVYKVESSWTLVKNFKWFSRESPVIPFSDIDLNPLERRYRDFSISTVLH